LVLVASPRKGRVLDHSTEMCSGSEAGSYLRLTDSCITQLKAQGPVTRVKKKDLDEAARKLGWHQAGPPNHHDDKVDSDKQVVNKELSLSGAGPE